MVLSGKVSPIKILLADDDRDDREMFAEAVAEVDASVQITCVEDGILLLDFLKQEKRIPHLIFLDLNMPHKNGKECLDEIRGCARFDDVPVVIYSTSSSPKDIEDTFSKGANLYIRKPSSYKELKMLAKTILLVDWGEHKPYSLRSAFVFPVKSA